jgi:hypothetical protein
MVNELNEQQIIRSFKEIASTTEIRWCEVRLGDIY